MRGLSGCGIDLRHTYHHQDWLLLRDRETGNGILHGCSPLVSGRTYPSAELFLVIEVRR